MSFTYAELKQAIKDYTENDETTFTNNLPVFIRNAEERILKNVQLSVFRKNVVGTSTASNQFLDCPSDFLAPFSLSFEVSSSKIFVEYKDVNFLQTFNPNSSTTGTPKYYAMFDSSNFILSPNFGYVMEARLLAGFTLVHLSIQENDKNFHIHARILGLNFFKKNEKVRRCTAQACQW